MAIRTTSGGGLPQGAAPRPRAEAGIDRAAAEALAIEALTYLAADPELLSRFLALTGIEADQIRQAARSKGFLAGVLRFVAAHEPTLLAFSAAVGRQPADVNRAIAALPFGDDQFDRST